MITGTTKSGFNFEIAEETLDDYELLEALVEADKGDDNMAVFRAIDLILDAKQKTDLKEHLRKIHGRVPVSAMVIEIMDILEGSTQGKNLSTSPA